MSIRLSAMALVVAASVPLSARAADDGELQAIRSQLDQLKATYEGRIQALEARLEALQQRLDSKAAADTDAPSSGAGGAPVRSATAAPPPEDRSVGSAAPTGAAVDPRPPVA